MPITVERIDFISVPTQDIERSRGFYTETLGLPFDRETPTGFEVTAGQVTLGKLVIIPLATAPLLASLRSVGISVRGSSK